MGAWTEAWRCRMEAVKRRRTNEVQTLADDDEDVSRVT